jgi:fimbrial chaperone protein
MKPQAIWIRCVLSTALAAAALGGPAHAATFTVNPTQVFLARGAASALVSLRNESSETLRFELSVFAWSQTVSGEMKLEPTDDVVFFPSLLTLKPSEERRVRVGSVAASGSTERTYRLFVKELPPVEGAAGGGVRVLTTMGIPIFVRPLKELASASLNGLHREDGQLKFAIVNTGTVHFVPQAIRVRGLHGEAELFDQAVDSWYVLAAGRREFAVQVPKDQCHRVTRLAVHVTFASETLEERLQTPGGACGP